MAIRKQTLTGEIIFPLVNVIEKSNKFEDITKLATSHENLTMIESYLNAEFENLITTMTESYLNAEFGNLIKQTLNQYNQDQVENMTATENHNESGNSPDFFQDNNAIKKKKKKKKLVPSHRRSQELNQEIFIKYFLCWYQQGGFLQPKLCI